MDPLARRLLVGTFRDGGERGMRPTHVPFLLFFLAFSNTMLFGWAECRVPEEKYFVVAEKLGKEVDYELASS